MVNLVSPGAKHRDTAGMNLVVYPQREPLTGHVSAPGDKSISHRAVLLAGLAEGKSILRGWLPSGDTLATLEAMIDLGIEIDVKNRSAIGWDIQVNGLGLRNLRQPRSIIDCGNAGTCMRLLSGIAAGQLFPLTLDGSQQLRSRPMGRVTNPLRKMGALVDDTGGRAPLLFRPSALTGISYEMPVASAQVKSALLLAGLYSQGRTEVLESSPTRDHTETMLRAMGVDVETGPSSKWIEGPITRLSPLDMNLPGDMSSAAFLLVAGLVVPHSDVTVKGVGINRTRSGLMDILSLMGAEIDMSKRSQMAGEPTADVRIRFHELESVAVGGESVVRAIDEFPIWAVAASQARGASSLSGASELRLKEVDRISLLGSEMTKLGADFQERSDGFSISGPNRLMGGEVNSHGDHRLAMALAVAGLLASGPTIILNAGCIADSYPGFVDTMQELGADMRWEKPRA